MGGATRAAGFEIVVIIGADLEDFRPFHGPEVGEFRGIEETGDERGAFVRIRVGGEGGEFFWGGREPGEVETDPAEEGCVGGWEGRRDLELAETGEDGVVDEVERGDGVGPCEVVGFGEDDDFGTGGELVEAAEDPCAAAGGGGDGAFFGDGGGAVVVREEEGEGGDIADRAVRVVGHDDGAVGGRGGSGGFEGEPGREHADAGD